MSDRCAFEMTLPNGVTVRRLSTCDLAFGLAKRIDSIWSAGWFVSHRAASITQRRFVNDMLHKSGLRPDQYESVILPLRRIAVPAQSVARAQLPNGRRVRHYYLPDWDETKPIAVIAVADRIGWRTGEWVTSREEQDRQVKRLAKLHDGVKVCDVAS